MRWSQIDMRAGTVRLEPGATKNGQGRTFPFTADLRELLEGQRRAHEALKAEGTICPVGVLSTGR